MRLFYHCALIFLLLASYEVAAASASAAAQQQRFVRSRQQETVNLLQFPCRLSRASIEIDEDPLYDWFCVLNPLDADGVAELTLPVEGLVLTESQEASVVDGVTLLFVEGCFMENLIIVIPSDADDISLTSPPESSQSQASGSASRDDIFTSYPTPFGDKTVLIVRVIATGGIQNVHSKNDLSETAFGTEGPFNSMATQFDACSYGQFTTSPFDGEINGKRIHDGVLEIEIQSPGSVGDVGVTKFSIETLVTIKLAEELGNNWRIDNEIDFVMYCLPAFGFTAYAYLNNYLSVYSQNRCVNPKTMMHELGHSLYLQHSNQDGIEYQDFSGLMGGFGRFADYCFNGPNSWQLGWYSDRHLEIDYKVGWSGELVGVADYDETSASQPVVLRFEIPQTFGEYIYVAFNRADGINVGTQEGRDQVLVTSQFLDFKSQLLALLDEGSEYDFEDFGGSGDTVRIRVGEIHLNSDPATARISVEVLDDGCFETSTFTDFRGCDW